MQASSPKLSAAIIVIKPVISQATSNHPGEPRVRDISALTIKMPEPIIEPMTIAEESTRFRLFLNAGWLVSDMGDIRGKFIFWFVAPHSPESRKVGMSDPPAGG